MDTNPIKDDGTLRMHYNYMADYQDEESQNGLTLTQLSVYCSYPCICNTRVYNRVGKCQIWAIKMSLSSSMASLRLRQ